MPPSPSPSEHEVTNDQHARLTDQDVAILHQIVLRAQQQPDIERLPFRAIFASYDAVLAENGLEADHDQTYLRFLFKLGDKGLEGKSLYEKFEALLEQMGIRLEFDDDSAGQQQTLTDIQNTAPENEETQGLQRLEGANHRGRRGRASFNSTYDAGNERTQSSTRRPSSRSSVSRLQIGKHSFLEARSSRTTARKKERTQSLDRTQPIGDILAPRGRLTAREFASGLLQHHPRNRSISSARNVQIWRKSDPQGIHSGIHPSEQDEPPLQHGSDDSNGTLSYLGDDGSIEQVQLPPELLYRPTETSLLRDADTFNKYRLQGFVRRNLSKWHGKAVQLHQDHRHLDAIATSRDRITLLRQAIDLWRIATQQKRHVVQTERFFGHLEKRAARARDLYLLTKAFTHWASVASDEVARTSVARRHILRKKYFNAWRDIAAVNELKAERFGLKGPFHLWKRRYVQILANEATAISVYHENLTRYVYWRWFWSFCDRRAPQWRDARLKRKTFILWIRALRTQRERDSDLEFNRDQTLLRSTLQKWSEQSQALSTTQEQADAFRIKKLLQSRFEEWRIQTRLAPMALRVSRTVDWRVARSTSAIWILRTRMVHRTDEVNRLRIMRNAWTAWNDRLRTQTLSARIDERLVLQNLYKWVLAERFRLMNRIHEQWIKRKALAKIVKAYREINDSLLEQEQRVNDQRNRRLLASTLDCWKVRMSLNKEEEKIALEFHAPRIEQETLEAWRSRVRNVQKMEGWARDAEFYFLMTNVIKKWHSAAVESTKQRRRDAYATIRRRVKMNLARKIVGDWRSRSDHLADLDREAQLVHQGKLMRHGTGLFDRWREQASQRLQAVDKAEQYARRNVLYKYLQQWITIIRTLQLQNERANEFAHIVTSELARVQLRKLSFRLFEIRNRLETSANAMEERNHRKHLRNMFRHWQEKTGKPRISGDMAGVREAQESNSNIDYVGFGATKRAADWTKFGEGLDISDWIPAIGEPQSSSTPMPGYLSTPSKRAVRARALAKMSTTPATPLMTPFAARLRAQIPRSARESGTRATFGRSLLGSYVQGIEDADEGDASPTHRRAVGDDGNELRRS